MQTLIRRTPLIGRERELAVLLERVAATGAGAGGVVLLAGDAGIGKSRLVAEVKAHAAQRGFLILQGACFETDRSLPYAPLLDMLRGLLAGRPPGEVAALLGGAVPALLPLLPELALHLPNAAPAPALDPDQEKHRLVQALTQVVAGLAARQPVLVVVEDLHWGDEASLELLLSLARRLAARPVLLLLTYRGDEVQPGLASVLAELDRARLATEVRLRPLTAAEVEAMLRAIFAQDRPVRAEFLAAIHKLTEGNPFFVEEVLKSLVMAGDIFYADGRWDRKPLSDLRIPRTIEEAVRRRVERLSGGARDTLLVAAVIGQRVDFVLLQTLTGQDEIALLGQLKELIAAQLVVEESADAFAFRHALTRQAVYAGLLARERRALHRRVAEAMEQLYDAAPDAMHLADLAYHAYEAGAWEKALTYARRAGERAWAMHAPRAAAEHFTRALAAARTLGLAPSSALHRARGQAYETLGEFEAGRADLEAALAAARAGGDRRAEWQALLALGLLWAARDYAQTGDCVRRALALARELADPSLLAHSLNRLGNWHMNADRPREAQRHHEEALAMFEALGDRRGIAETVELLGLATGVAGDSIRGAAYYERAAELFRELDDRRGLAWCLAMLTYQESYLDTVVFPPDMFATAVRRGEQAVALAREIGWRAGEAFALSHLAWCLAVQGDCARVLALMRATLAIADEIGHRQWLGLARLAFGMFALEVLALPAACHQFEQALALATEIGSVYFQRHAAGGLALAHLLQGDLARARAVLDRVLTPDSPHESIPLRLCWRARAELALAGGDPALALTIADQLVASAANLSAETVIPGLWLLRGQALAALGRPAEAEATLNAARAAVLQKGIPSLLWRAHVALGAFYQAQARPADAEREFAAARAIGEALAANAPDEPVPELEVESLRAHFLATTGALLPRPRPPTPLRAAKQAYGGLTARERDVAALLARGRSNREIAAALSIGESTVETHVSNILAKLGCASRAQVAAWAVEKGLLAPDE